MLGQSKEGTDDKVIWKGKTTMKAYTDINQSKKLAEILPLESADMYWLNRHIDLTETKYEVFVIDKSNKFMEYFKSYVATIDNNEIIPCWSLAALLDVISYPTLSQEYDNKWSCREYQEGEEVEGCENPVDACYELIIQLHEQKLL